SLETTGQEAFRVVASHFAATLQAKDSRQNGRLLLADLNMHCRRAGDSSLTANYYLVPGGRDEAVLQLPVNSQLVQVLVNDAPAEVRSGPDQTWKIRLAHDQLAQQVLVIVKYATQTDSTNEVQALAPI